MTLTQNIIESICWLNEQYRELNGQEKNDENRVQLGRSFKIADKFQFDLASRISNSLQADKIIVDYPTSCTNRTQPLYPDIQLIKKGKLKAIVEIKIDLGFLRLNEFGITYDKPRKEYAFGAVQNAFKQNYEDFLSSDEIWFRKKGNRERVVLRKNDSLKKIFIVVSRKNHTRRGPYFEAAMEDAGFNLLFLLDDIHPNHHHDLSPEIKSRIENKEKEIKRLFKGL